MALREAVRNHSASGRMIIPEKGQGHSVFPKKGSTEIAVGNNVHPPPLNTPRCQYELLPCFGFGPAIIKKKTTPVHVFQQTATFCTLPGTLLSFQWCRFPVLTQGQKWNSCFFFINIGQLPQMCVKYTLVLLPVLTFGSQGWGGSSKIHMGLSI